MYQCVGSFGCIPGSCIGEINFHMLISGVKKNTFFTKT